MPRIDPLQLLKCLSVLLSPEGGILSRDEVPRLVNLMTKFSKKLVSKCVYVLILKNTETCLVDMFMAEGGWTLIQTWLQDAAQSGNWDLVKEILGLLLVTPVDVERLKMNCLPKLIKNLSRREDLGGVAQLSNQIVQNWLAIVKGSGQGTAPVDVQQAQPDKVDVMQAKVVSEEAQPEHVVEGSPVDNIGAQTEVQNEEVAPTEGDHGDSINSSSNYHVSLRDGKQIIKKLPSTDETDNAVGASALEGIKETVNQEKEDVEKTKEKKSEKSGEKDKSKSKTSSSSKGSKTSHSSKRSKEKDKKSANRSKNNSSATSNKSNSSSSSSRDKDKERKNKDKDHKSNGSIKSSKSSSEKSNNKDKKEPKDIEKEKDHKEKQAEKDKDTLAKIKPQTLDKLGRIPKKSGSSTSSDEKNKDKSKDDSLKKKPSFSILDRKSVGEERTKTVKVFNSKMRSTGLEEEVKPPPPRTVKKTPPSVQLPTIPAKRPSPPREPSSMPPEKKLKIDKIDVPERPGAIKLIPPKPKPAVLQESDIFMDALTASATAKKEPKKRKRRLSVSKDTPTSPSSSPASGDPHTPVSPTQTAPSNSSTLGLKSIEPINFYQDTLSEDSQQKADKEENKENDENNENKKEENDIPSSPSRNVETIDTPSEPKVPKLTEGLKGVLLYSKKRGPKRSIQWKAEADLVEIRYFELDETERVNVTKTFMDMAKLEMSSEREALQLSRKLANEDVMEPQTSWRLPFMCDQPDPLVIPGCKSLEKDIQFAREKSVLQALYFDKRRIPDSPEEPIPENHQMSDPVIIPLEDPESQEIDLKNTPWPDPKGSPPHVEPQMPPIFQNIPPFNPNFNNMPPPQFQGMPPRFGGPMVHPGPQGPGNFGPPNMMPGGNMMGPPNMGPPQDLMPQGPINPNMFGPGPVHDNFAPPVNDNPNFPMPPFNGPGPMNMFPPNNFNHRGGRGFRRGGGGNNSGGWVRMNAPGPGNWKRGGGHRGGRFCKNVQNHGYCRNRDNCPFVHPS